MAVHPGHAAVGTGLFWLPIGALQEGVEGQHAPRQEAVPLRHQDAIMDDEARRKHCRAFLTKGLEKKNPNRSEFTAYGQACLEMATWHHAIAPGPRGGAIRGSGSRNIRRPADRHIEEYLRKDHVFLFERFFYLLEEKQKFGLLVMDEAEKTEDRRFVRRMERYFTKTAPGQYRTTWIVPSPFFVASDMNYAVQAADMCIYCVNWGFRLEPSA